MSEIPNSTVTTDIMPSTDTHGTGDRCKEKPLSPSNSLVNVSDISTVTSFTSCESFKTICSAWKNRLESESMSKLDRNIKDLEAKVENCTSKLNVSRNVSEEELSDIARSVSMCVVMESRSLQLTDSSENEMSSVASNFQRRFLEPQEIREAYAVFRQHDVNGDNFIELSELKMALERLSVPQTHLSAKQLMAEIAGPHSPKLSFCQFLLAYAAILHDSALNDIQLNQSLVKGVTPLEPVNVSKEAVSNVKRFFEAKVAQQSPEPHPKSSKKADSPKNIVLDI